MHMTNYLDKKMQLNELKYALFYLYAADVNFTYVSKCQLEIRNKKSFK